MEVASMMPSRIQDAYNPSLQYAQYHDMRTPIAAAPLAAAPMGMHGMRHTDYNHYQPQQATSDSPVAAPTPPEDPNKPSLPSISNLLGIADGERTSQPQSESHSPSQQKPQPIDHTSYTMSADPVAPNGYAQKMSYPPTPPMRSDSMPEAVQSPSTISSQSSFSGPQYALGSAMNNVDAAQQRAHMSAAPMTKPMHIPQPMYSPYGIPQPYMASPVSVSPASYYSPEAVYSNGMYQQRPLPSNFPPVMAAPMLPPGMVPGASPWEHHHHYMNVANQAAFQSMQDRYICPTCKKAFSRPSSLKIHSHSHTGEKPFKCPHTGCGKAFSVRSNMKRHERGCHTPGMEEPAA